MFADNIRELHHLARQIGLKCQWLHESRLPHYDLTEVKRAKAVAGGAVELTSAQVREYLEKKGRDYCSVCEKLLADHPRCESCGLLFGPRHLAIAQGDGRCQYHGSIAKDVEGCMRLVGEVLKPGAGDPEFFLTPAARHWAGMAGMVPETLREFALKH